MHSVTDSFKSLLNVEKILH